MSVIVLIVDDDEGVRFFHKVIVLQSKLSTKPLSFKSGEEVFDYLNQYSNENDTYLILLDINMPQMNGWEFLDAISGKSYYNQVHIVMVTSSVDKGDHEKAKLYSKVIDVTEKPISHEECKRIMNYSSIARYFKPLKKMNKI